MLYFRSSSFKAGDDSVKGKQTYEWSWAEGKYLTWLWGK